VVRCAPVVPFRVSRNSRAPRLTPRRSHEVHLEQVLERFRKLLFGAGSTLRCVAGRLAFPASSLALPPTRLAPDGADLRGLPHRVADSSALLTANHGPTLRLLCGAPSCCPDRLTPASSPGVGPVARVAPNAWPHRPSVSFAPSCEGPSRVNSQRNRSNRFRPPDANPEVPFRPRGISPPRRLSPRNDSQACCILQPTLGFASFHTDQPKPAAIPATRPPLEGISHLPVVLRSPGALAPLAFALADSEPAHHCWRSDAARFEAGTFEALSVKMVCNVDARFRTQTPCPSWASISSSRSRRRRG